MAAKPLIIDAAHDQLGRVFVAVDPAARYVEGKVANCRLGALLSPYADEQAARAALAAAGGKVGAE